MSSVKRSFKLAEQLKIAVGYITDSKPEKALVILRKLYAKADEKVSGIKPVRKPSDYNKFMKDKIKSGMSFTDSAAMWSASKGKKSKSSSAASSVKSVKKSSSPKAKKPKTTAAKKPKSAATKKARTPKFSDFF